MTNEQHHANEMKRFLAECEQIRKAPLSDRKEARADLVRFWNDEPETFADRCRWVLDGAYGYGAYHTARAIANASKRSNRAAQLSQLTALMECQCPENFTRDAWNGLRPEQQTALTAAVDAVLADWLKDQAEEAELSAANQ